MASTATSSMDFIAFSNFANVELHPEYNDPDADIIVRSSDGGLYRLYKVMLAKASPIMKDTFTLPPSSHSAEGEGGPIDGLPVVNITEDSETLNKLLLFIYPGARPPKLPTLEDVVAMLEASRKYEMAMVAEYAQSALSAFAKTQPLRAFCVAHSFQLKEETTRAAKLCLGIRMWPPPPMPAEICLLPSTLLYRLFVYYDQCKRVAVETVTNMKSQGDDIGHYRYVEEDTIVVNWVWINCKSCPRSREMMVMKKGKKPGDIFQYSRWWEIYMNGVAQALETAPCGPTAKRPALLAPAFQAAGACSTCGPKVHEELVEFRDLLAQRIDKVVLGVTLDLDL